MSEQERWTDETQDLVANALAWGASPAAILAVLADAGLLVPPGGKAEVHEQWQGKGHPQLYNNGEPDGWMNCGNEATAKEFDSRRHRTVRTVATHTPWVEVTDDARA